MVITILSIYSSEFHFYLYRKRVVVAAAIYGFEFEAAASSSTFSCVFDSVSTAAGGGVQYI